MSGTQRITRGEAADLLAQSLMLITRYWWLFALYVGLGWLFNYSASAPDGELSALKWASTFPFFFLPLYLHFFMCAVVLQAGERGRVSFRECLSVAFWQFPAAFASSFMCMWMILFGFVAIVPGLYLSARLCWVPQCVLYENAGALQAIQWSWDRTRGQVWLIFLSFVLPLIVLILVAISTGRAVELWSLVVPASGLIAGLAEQTVWLTILAGAVLVGVTNTMLYLRTVLEHEPFAGLPRR